MRDLIVLLFHLIATVFRIAQPGGLRSVIAESVLIKHQLLIVNRSRRRAPNLRIWDRLIAGLVLPVDPASPSLAISDRIQAIDPVEFPSRSGSAQIQIPVFAKTPNEAGTKRSRSAPNSCRCPDEAAQSEMGMSAHCRADQSGLWHLYK